MRGGVCEVRTLLVTELNDRDKGAPYVRRRAAHDGAMRRLKQPLVNRHAECTTCEARRRARKIKRNCQSVVLRRGGVSATKCASFLNGGPHKSRAERTSLIDRQFMLASTVVALPSSRAALALALDFVIPTCGNAANPEPTSWVVASEQGRRI